MGAPAAATTITPRPGSPITLRAIGIRALVFALALVVLGYGLLGISGSSLARSIGSNGPAAGVAAAATCDPDWQIVPSPNQGPEDNSLGSVAVVSPTDVWAVGYYRDIVWQTLTQHWDGTQWSTVSSPTQGTDYNELRSVAAVSSSDVWAVGYFSGEYPAPSVSTLTEHWDGTSWIIVPSRNEGGYPSSFRSVAAVSSNDVWAVGYWGHGLILQALVEHWNGTAWEVVPVPQPSTTYDDLYSVVAISANDVWAVGSYWESPVIRPLVEHWNGTQWEIVPSPNQGAFGELRSIAAVSPTDVWAVGSYYIDPYNAVYKTLIQHWDGTSWAIVPSPNQGDDYNVLLSVAAVSANDVWAVGHYREGLVYRTLVQHWDGTSWTIVPSPNQGTGSNDLLSVAVASPNDLWAVGFYHNGSVYQTLTQRYNPCPPSPTPTLTGTPPTSTPTHTPTDTPTHTSTGTATPPLPGVTPTETLVPPTPCAMSFSDVLPGGAFYPYVMCLACRGIVSGYSDGTFHPNDNITRGQICKIVANAAGFNEPVEGQTFSDVPPGHTFYEYIERLGRRGFISGYADGTFRPADSATRGQICKIVANTAGYHEPVSGQTFTDVPPGHAFYEYVERMASRGIASGYGDGTFRPQNNATRGQVSKIVANTFFPNCQALNRNE